MPVQLGIIDELIHPSIGRLSRTAVAGNPQIPPFFAAAPPQPPFNAPTYGIVLRIHSVGAFHGRDVAFPQQYDPPLGKISANYQDNSGLLVTQQIELWTFDNQWYAWDQPFPTLVTVYFAPDVSADVFWLQT